jgi:hypothetical protein
MNASAESHKTAALAMEGIPANDAQLFIGEFSASGGRAGTGADTCANWRMPLVLRDRWPCNPLPAHGLRAAEVAISVLYMEAGSHDLE